MLATTARENSILRVIQGHNRMARVGFERWPRRSLDRLLK